MYYETRQRLRECWMPVIWLKGLGKLLPELPDGVAPAYIQYIDVIHHLLETNDCVKVSDISDWLNLPRPGVTVLSRKWKLRDILRRLLHRKMQG